MLVAPPSLPPRVDRPREERESDGGRELGVASSAVSVAAAATERRTESRRRRRFRAIAGSPGPFFVGGRLRPDPRAGLDQLFRVRPSGGAPSRAVADGSEPSPAVQGRFLWVGGCAPARGGLDQLRRLMSR